MVEENEFFNSPKKGSLSKINNELNILEPPNTGNKNGSIDLNSIVDENRITKKSASIINSARTDVI